MKHLATLLDYEEEEILECIDLADQLKYELENKISHPHLKGKSIGILFEKPSTRTRLSFEVGIYQLGANAIYLSSQDMQMGRGEPIQDTARVLSRYLDALMIRTFKQKTVEDLMHFGSIPIINGLTDEYHPCQILADLMTIRNYKQRLKSITLAYIGDCNNVARSLIIGGLKMGMQIQIASPKPYGPQPDILAFIKNYPGQFLYTEDPALAAKNADVLYTDVWASMGQEKEQEERKKIFEGYQINKSIMKLAKPDVIVMHDLPAHREEEITTEVFEVNATVIFDQAENRMHAQKAVLVKLLT